MLLWQTWVVIQLLHQVGSMRAWAAAAEIALRAQCGVLRGVAVVLAGCVAGGAGAERGKAADGHGRAAEVRV